MTPGRSWKKHPKKELEAVLAEFNEAGWSIKDPPTYYSVKCPCGSHMRFVHLTPSDPYYARNVRAWLKRQPCMQAKEADE